MYQIKMENCNNIIQGELTIENGKLNIFLWNKWYWKNNNCKGNRVLEGTTKKIKELQSKNKEFF